MPENKRHRTEPTSFVIRENTSRFDLSFNFTVNSGLFADLPNVLECIIDALPHSFLVAHASSSAAYQPAKTDTSPTARRKNPPGTKKLMADIKTTGATTTRKKVAASSVSNVEVSHATPRIGGGTAAPPASSTDAAPPSVLAPHLVKGYAQRLVTELLRDNPSNSPLTFTLLGRAQADLSSFLSGQVVVEQKCNLVFLTNVLKQQNPEFQPDNVQATQETVLKVKVTLNSTNTVPSAQ